MDCIEKIVTRVELHPEVACIMQGDKTITYREFIDLVYAMAFFLKKHSYSKVIVNMNQGTEGYALIVAVLMIGGCYCPLNLDSPEDRKSYIISEFDPHVVISGENLVMQADKLSDHKQIVMSELRSKALLENSSLPELYNHAPGEEAYVIYTSGSTGNPKGVIIRRKSLNQFLQWSLKAYNCSSTDRWAQYSSLSFDLSIVDIFTALCSGCTLIPLSEAGQKLRPANTVDKHKVSVWHSVPGAVDFMIRNEGSRPADLSSLRLMSFCGEPLFEYHLTYLFSKNPGMTIFNTYGPTEGTLFCTWVELNINNYRDYCDSTISIGKAIPGWNLYLQNFERENDIKEVIIYGNYIGKGYLNLDTGAFYSGIINEQTQNAYRTGDLVKAINGNLYFVGRTDNQIKLRGYRIELDEIDKYVMKITGSKSVSILHGEAIHTFIEADSIDESALRNGLEKDIEKYKIPSYFHVISTFPRNSNQKVDRLKLKKIIDEKRDINLTV